ncbi:MAG: hypothetical protein N3A01_00210 [Bacteroidales bacterium]|nr:hypothetical protein [Bacteroidales bacterium]
MSNNSIKLSIVILFLFFTILSISQVKQVELQFSDTVNKVTFSVPVWIDGKRYDTDSLGRITIELSYGDHNVVVMIEGYEIINQKITISEGTNFLFFPLIRSVVYAEENIQEIELDNQTDKQLYGSILNAFDDIYSRITGYQYSQLFHKNRGYENDNQTVFINGLPIFESDDFNVNYNIFSGLNNITKNKINSYSIQKFDYGIQGVNGATQIIINAADVRKQNVLTYSNSNVTYNHQIRYTYSSGLMPKGWAYSFSFSKRYAERSYIKGTWFDGFSYYGSIEKVLNKHSLSLSLIGSSYKRALSSPAVEETFNLLNSHYYNPNWGYQNGIIRNAKVRSVHQPLIVLSDKINFSKKFKVFFNLGYQFGHYNNTALNWYNANDPRPDYYRYLPSYYSSDSVVYHYTQSYWVSSPFVYQINWDNLYQINYLANNEGKSARYILEKRHEDVSSVKYSTFTKYQLNNYTEINAGIYGQFGTNKYYKTVDDLLGANYWLDIDQYAERDFPNNDSILYNDLNNPNKIVKKGDIFGYNYKFNYQFHYLWFQVERTFKKIDISVKPFFTYSSYQREGLMRNGRYPNNSYGKSKTYYFLNYGYVGNLLFKITGRHLLFYNTYYKNLAPSFNSYFINPQICDLTINNKLISVFSNELSYEFISQMLRVKLSGYKTSFDNDIEKMSFYHDQYRTFVNVTLTNVDKIYQGIEFAGEVKITKTLFFEGAANISQNKYISRPIAYINFANGSKPDTLTTSYLKYFNLPGYQKIVTAGLNYKSSNFWFIGLHFVFATDNYIQVNPLRRTEEAVLNLLPNDPLIKEIIEQKKLKSAFLLNFSIGKSWKINKQYISLNLNVNNILNNQNIVSYAFEQLRFDYENRNVNKFPPKYSYVFGRTYYFTITYRF